MTPRGSRPSSGGRDGGRLLDPAAEGVDVVPQECPVGAHDQHVDDVEANLDFAPRGAPSPRTARTRPEIVPDPSRNRVGYVPKSTKKTIGGFPKRIGKPPILRLPRGGFDVYPMG